MGQVCLAPPSPEPEIKPPETTTSDENSYLESPKQPPSGGVAPLPSVKEEPAGEKPDNDAPKEEPAAAINNVEPEAAKVAEGKMDLLFRDFCSKTTPAQKEELKDVTGKQQRRPSSVGTTLDAYAGIHSDELQRFKKLKDSPDWQFKKTEQGVDIYTMTVPGDVRCSFKGVTKIKTQGRGIQHIFFGLLQVSDRPKWDELCISGKTLECYLPFYRVSYYALKSPVPIISNRDVCVIARGFYEEDGSIITNAQSVVHPDMPERAAEGFVRINLTMNTYQIKPTEDPDEFEVTVVGSADLKGWIPVWLTNILMWKQALSLAKLKVYLSKA